MNDWLVFAVCLAGVLIPLLTFWTSRRGRARRSR